MKEPYYNLKAVCKLTRLRATTLHAWEKRYGAIQPIRTHTNHRLYTAADVEKLCLLVAAKDLGHAIGQVAQLTLDQLKQLISSSSPPASEARPQGRERSSRPNSSIFCKRTLQALDEYDLERVHVELGMARNRFDALTFVLDILVPLYAAVGRMVEQQQLSIIKEHALSGIIKANVLTETLRLRMAHQSRPGGSLKAKRIALATFDGDYHETGILLAAILCVEQGFAVSYLGPSIPALALAEAACALRIDILIMSQPKVPLRYLPQNPMDYLVELASHMPKLCELWLGGEDPDALTQLSLARKTLHITTLHDLNKQLMRSHTFPNDSKPILS